MRALGFPVSKKEAREIVRAKAAAAGTPFTVELPLFCEVVEGLASRRHDHRREIVEGFRLFDADGQGSFGLAELKAVCASVGEEMSGKEMEAMFQLADTDGDGRVGEDEFVRIMAQTNLFRDHTAEDPESGDEEPPKL